MLKKHQVKGRTIWEIKSYANFIEKKNVIQSFFVLHNYNYLLYTQYSSCTKKRIIFLMSIVRQTKYGSIAGRQNNITYI